MKRSRQFRREQTERVIHNRKKSAKLFNLDISEAHRFAKKHPLDCGNPQCFVCHGNKILDEDTIRDIQIDDKTKDEIQDLNNEPQIENEPSTEE